MMGKGKYVDGDFVFIGGMFLFSGLFWSGLPMVAALPCAVAAVTVVGIAVRNGIMMISHFRHLEEEEGVPFGDGLAIRGAEERLAPILMTALTTLLGLVPIAVQRPSLGGVYYYSMALVIMGGLFVSTFLTSVLLPTMAALVEDSFGALGRWIGRLSAMMRISGHADHDTAA